MAVAISVVDVFIVVTKIQYFKETDSLKARNYSDIPVAVMLRQELKEAKERAKNAPAAAESLSSCAGAQRP